jgi:hypothetical protein
MSETTLTPGETLNLDTRVSGGPTVTRDELVDDAYAIDDHGGELSRGEIKQLAEAAGLEVADQ